MSDWVQVGGPKPLTPGQGWGSRPGVSSWELLPTRLRVLSAGRSSVCLYEEVYRRDERCSKS